MNSLARNEEASTEDWSELRSDTTDRREDVPYYVKSIAEMMAHPHGAPSGSQEATSFGEGDSRLTAAGEDGVVFLVPQLDRNRERRLTAVLVPLQEWEGHVVSVGREGFTARLRDITHGAPYEDEEADFAVDEVSPEDRGLLRSGAIFRWVIAYKTTDRGKRETVAQIVFRRLPQWSASEVEQATRTAEEKAKQIRWD